VQPQAVLLSVAIPEFDPGLPKTADGELDYDKIDSEGIYPELRRTEAKKFAVKTKVEMDKSPMFGDIVVTPDAAVPADIFVIGKILESDSETVEVQIDVTTVGGQVLGSKQIEHEVSSGFLKDRARDGQNTYAPLFTKIAEYVKSVVAGIGTSERLALQDLNKVSYAMKYSPEAFASYLQVANNGEVQLVAKPADGDPMLARVEKLKNHEYMFLDRMQEQYVRFDSDTEQSYQNWQRTALDEIKEKKKAQTQKIVGGLFTALATAVAVNQQDKNNTIARDIAAGAAVVGAVATVAAANRQAEQQEIINEMASAADYEMSPMNMEFEGQKAELKGTAAEQYTQWRAHLKKIFDLENGESRPL
jgi:hypothetical protein